MSRGWFSESGKLLAVLNMPTDALFTSNIPLTFDKGAEALSLEIRRRVGASWRIRTSDPQLRSQKVQPLLICMNPYTPLQSLAYQLT